MPYKDGIKYREYQKQWYTKNKEKMILRAREWGKQNPEKRIEICKRWYESHHPDKKRREGFDKFYKSEQKKLENLRKFKKELSEERHREKSREKRFKNFTIDYDTLLEKQKGQCAICKQEKKLSIDHCHKSKKFRGLLCTQCNLALGLLKEDLRILQNAIEYLNEHSVKKSKFRFSNPEHTDDYVTSAPEDARKTGGKNNTLSRKILSREVPF